MGSLSIWHWLIVAVIVALVFGTKKLRGAGRDLGEAVRGFKEGAMGVAGPTDAELAASKAKAESTASASSAASQASSSDASPR